MTPEHEEPTLSALSTCTGMAPALTSLDASIFDEGVRTAKAGGWISDCPYGQDQRDKTEMWRSGYCTVMARHLPI